MKSRKVELMKVKRRRRKEGRKEVLRKEGETDEEMLKNLKEDHLKRSRGQRPTRRCQPEKKSVNRRGQFNIPPAL